jgi:hypothetical protein
MQVTVAVCDSKRSYGSAGITEENAVNIQESLRTVWLDRHPRRIGYLFAYK